MPKTAEALINPEVLSWARETVGFSVEDLAEKLKVDVSKVMAWEAGDERPSISKLKMIADKLKRPMAVFYLPAPPLDTRPPKDFRGVIQGHAGFFSPRLHVELRLAEVRRDDALALLNELEEEPVEFTFKSSLDDDPEEVAGRLTRFLEVDSFMLSRCRDEYEARKIWKTAAEEKGALVFQATGVDVSEMRGFSFSLFPLPVAVVNSKDSPKGQMFSLLHELTHIALRQDGICDFNEDLPRDADLQQLEVFCNHVAGAALVPRQQLLQHEIVKNNRSFEAWTNQELSTLSNYFKCSREVILRRLLIHNLTTEEFYSQKREAFIQEYKELESSKKDGFAVKYSKKVINRNGYFFSRLVLNSYNQEVITGPELSRLLNMKLKHLSDMTQALQA